MAVCALTCASAVGTVDPIYEDGFDGPKWFIDADNDSYGNPAVFIHALTKPDGYVANALDCDDSNPAIHPGVADDPDAGFVDSNCDGIDGDIAKAIFVATGGIDGMSCGTQASPCHTPAYAIGRLDAQHSQILVQVGTYGGAFAVSAQAAFFGGYDASWQRGPITLPGPNVQFAGSIATMGPHGAQAFAVYISPGMTAQFADIEVDAPNTSVTANGAGLDSYGLYADQGAHVQLARMRIVQGSGAAGAGGVDGISADQSAIPVPPSGGDASQVSVFCDDTSHGTGAAPSTNTCVGGRSVAAGNGGDGGTMDTSCSFPANDFTATSGATGGDAGYPSGSAGKGGTGGSGSDSCGPAQGGSAGFVADGSGGLPGIGSALVGGLWVAGNGGAGTLGENGGGGGGGGGSGGCDTGTDSYGAGGGGGGAGGCAAIAAGSGGGGGGASFGVFAYLATLDVSGSEFDLGHGGAGGSGGAAGIGQPGGKGGAAGIKAPNGGIAGGGGDGARGGVAGGGGGGQGGHVYGIYSYASTLTNSGNTFTGGVAGAGGDGGSGPAGVGAGQSGNAGAVGNVGVCATLVSC